MPLKETVGQSIEPEKRFTAAALLQAFPGIKYVIDLTNTDRYYDEKEFTNSGIKYEKVMVRGHDVPSMDVVKKFFKTMDDFTSSCGEDEIVGVHCTHGINRTGYLICRYLVQQLGWELENCLKAFESARGYPIEREAYLASLKKTPSTKLDTSALPADAKAAVPRLFFKHRGRPSPYTMGPPGFAPPRRNFTKDGPFSPPPFAFPSPPPGFRPMPPPGMPPIPPGSPLFSPRPFRYGPPPRAAMPPPGPAFMLPNFPPCPTRMPPPVARLPPPKMAPPPPPKMAPPSRAAALKRLQSHRRKSQARNDAAHARIRRNDGRRSLPKLAKEQDFTVDTFEENLLARQPGKRVRGRFAQCK